MTTPLEVDGPRPAVAWASTVEVDHPDDRMLLLVLSLDSYDGHKCQPVVRDLLAWCGWSSNRDRLYRARQRLADRRLLTWVESKGRKATRYHLLRPIAADQPSGEPSGIPGQLGEATEIPNRPGSPDGSEVQPSGQPSGEPSGIPGHALALALKNSLPPPPTEVQPPMLLPFEGGRDGLTDYAETVLADVPAKARPRGRDRLLAVLADGKAAGWEPEAIAAALADEKHDYGRVGGGAVLRSLETIIQRPAPRPPWQSCGECSNGWVEDPTTGLPVEKCTCHPTFDGPRPDAARNERRHEETAPTTSEVLAESAEERDARHRELLAPNAARSRAIASLAKRFGT